MGTDATGLGMVQHGQEPPVIPALPPSSADALQLELRLGPPVLPLLVQKQHPPSAETPPGCWRPNKIELCPTQSPETVPLPSSYARQPPSPPLTQLVS